MRRMFDGQLIETQEEMAECGLHQGRWENGGGFCVFDDPTNYEMYLEHVRVDRAPRDVGLDEQEQQIKDAYVSSDDQGPSQEALMTARAFIADEERNIEATERLLDYVGLSPNAPVEANDNGGLQSVVEGLFTELPPLAMFELAKVMEHGAKKYAPKNWHKIPVESHINHLLMHTFAWLAGDRQEKHLTHILARAAMAVELDEMARQALGRMCEHLADRT